jgi:hypothetical protein
MINMMLDNLTIAEKPLFGNVWVTKDDGKLKPAAIKVFDIPKGGTEIVNQRINSYAAALK